MSKLISKRLFVITSLSVFCVISVLAQPKVLKKGLKDYYKNYFPIGVAITPAQLADPEERKLILTQFNSLTAENAMKMTALHPEPNRYTWADADSIVNFATTNGLKVRGHTLCWHADTPDWFFKDDSGKTVGKEVLLNRLREHIYAVVGRYKGRVYAWDVVNEAVSDDPKSLLRNSLWYQICGEDFITKAFEYAHEADPNAVLFYNDYTTENLDKAQNIYKLIKKLVDQKVPVHAVGLQGHWTINYPSEEMLKQTIAPFADLGLKVQITELDVSVYPNEDSVITTEPELSANRAQKQAAHYAKLFKVFREFKETLTGVTFWNLSD
ncbi:MAG: endo-1,4-beta-xylanase, partial [Flavobacteriales bacterium]